MTVDVNDNDATGVMLSAPSGNVAEASGSKTITVAIDRGLVTGEALSLPLAIGGSAVLGTDYTLAAPDTLPTGVTYTTLGTAPTITFTGDSTPSATSATLTFTATQDNLDEGASETVTIGLPTLGAASGTNLSAGASGSGSLSFSVTDDDLPPALSVAATPSGAITEGTSVTYTVSTPNPSAKDLTIGFAVAQSGAFLSAGNVGAGTLTLSAGDTSVARTLATLSDQADEVDGSITFALSAPGNNAGYTLRTGGSFVSSVTTQVRDDDPTAVTLTVPAGNIVENAGTKTLTVALARGLVAGETLPVRVRFAGSATLGTDYTLAAPDTLPTGVTYATLGTAPTITFTGGTMVSATSATLTLTATQDTINEGASESIIVSLAPLNASSGTGLNGGAGGSGGRTFAITDDDTGGDLTITGGSAVNEGSPASFTVNLGAVSASATTVNYTVSQTGTVLAADEAGSKSVVITAGRTSATFTVATASDTIDEVSGSVDVQVNAGTGYTVSATNGSASVSVTDNDPTTVTIAATDALAIEGSDTNTATFTITLGRALVTDESLEVPIAVAGIVAAEYSLSLTAANGAGLTGNTLAFTGGDNAARVATITFTAEDDSNAADAANETVTVTIPATSATSADPRLNPSGLDGGASGSGTATITIVDAGLAAGEISVTGGAAVTEGAAATFTLSNSQAATTPTTVNVDVDETGSVLASGQSGTRKVVIAPGATTAIFTVATASDSTDEVSGSVDVTVETGTGYTVDTDNDADEASVAVADDDPTVVTLAAPDKVATEGSATATATLTLTLGRALVTGESLGVPIAVAGIAAAEYSLSLTAANGVALAANTVTFTGGAAAARVATITFTAEDDSDAADAANETVSVTIPTTSASDDDPRLAPTGLAGSASGAGSATITIIDAGISGGEVTIEAGNAVTEGKEATFTLEIDRASTSPTTVNVTIAETGSVLAANEAGTRQVVIPAGATTASFTVATASDSTDEVSGSITATVGNGTGYTVDTDDDDATVAVADDDPTIVTLAATDATATEGDADETAAFTLTLGRALVTGESLGVPIAVSGIAAAEYALSVATAPGVGLTGNTVTFTGGDNAARVATITFTANADSDAADVANESVTVTIPATSATDATPRLNPSGLDGDATGTGIARIAIIDAGVATEAGVTLSAATLAVSENGSATYTVVLDSDPGQAVTITPSAAGSDLSFQPTSVQFSGGLNGNWNTPRTITVSAAADGDASNDTATITHAITGYTGVTDSDISDINVTITDAGHGWVVEPASVTVQAGGPIQYTVRALSLGTGQLRFRAASDDTDVATVPSGFIRFAGASWQTGTMVTVTGVGVGTATITHTNRTANSEANYGSNGDTTIPNVTVTVKASGLPQVGIAADAMSFDEDDGSADFTVTTSEAAPSGGLTVNFSAAAEGDYLDGAASTSVTIAAGQTSAAVSIDLDDDNVDEANGSLALTLSDSASYTVDSSNASAEVALLDDDATTVALSGAGSIAETSGERSLTVALGRALVQGESLTVPLTFTGGATISDDYRLAAPAARPAGVGYLSIGTTTPSIVFTGRDGASSTATLRVLAVSDTAKEADEAINVALGTLDANSGTNLGGGASGSGTASFTIADDDGTGPVISVSGGDAVTEGTAASFTITATPAPDAALTVNLSVGSTGDFVAGTNLGAKTVTVPATGSATFTVATVADTADEASGSVTLAVSAGRGYTVSGTDGSASVTVNDNDATTVTLSAPRGPIGETGGSKEITITLGRALAAGETLAVPLNFTTPGTNRATFGTDYTLSQPGTVPTGVTYANLASDDLTENPPTITFTGRAGASRTATLIVNATSDTDSEPSESIPVRFGTLVANGLGGGTTTTGRATFAIVDDDSGLPVVSVEADDDAVTEGTAASFTIEMDPAPSADFSVNVNVGSTGNFVDSADLGGKVVTVDDDGEVTFEVDTFDDAADEASGSVTLTVSAGVGYTILGNGGSDSVTVNDDDATTVTLSAPGGNIGETGGSKVLTVTLGRALAAGETLAVPLTFAGAATRATFGTDYTLSAPGTTPTGVAYTNLASNNLSTSPPTITFTGAAGGSSRTATLTVSATSDAAGESNENIAVGFGTLVATGLDGGATTTGSVAFAITDDDASLPVVSVAAGAAVTEGAAASFTITMAPAPSANFSVNVNVGSTGNFVAGTNLGAKTVTVGATGSATFTVATLTDSVDEPNGSVTLAVSAGVGYTVSATDGADSVTVSDNDNTSVVLSAPAGNIGETGGSKEITITLGRALATGETLTAPLTFGGTATFGSDYTLSAQTPRPTGVGYSDLASSDLANSPPTVTFTGGAGASRTATVTVATVNNAVEETDEAITIALGTLVANTALGGATGSGTARFSIIDDDDPSLPTVSIAAGAFAIEGGNATFTVSVSPATHPALTVSYTVTQSGSFVASSSLGAGKTISLDEDAGSQTFSIATVNDGADEPQGAVTVTLVAAAAYQIGTGTASVTVADNDPTSVTLSAPAGNIAEDGGTKVITLTLGRPMLSGESIFVNLDLGGTAALNDDYTLLAPDSPPTGISYFFLDGMREVGGVTEALAPQVWFTGPAPESASLTLRANDDILDEGDAEAVTVGVGPALASTTLGANPRTSTSGTASFSITDDDGTPVISIAPGADATEGQNASFTLSASPAPQENISIALSVSQSGSFVAAGNLGTDKSVALGNGASSVTFTVATQGDSMDEPSGSVTVGVLAGSGYRPTSVSGEAAATVNVLDDDQSVVTLTGTGGNLTELVSPATDKLVITLNRALVGSEQIAVPIEFAGGAIGTEFSLAMATTTGAALNATTGVVTFTSGGSAATVQVAPLLDADEVNDTITASLGDLTLTGIDGGARATGSTSFDIIDAGPQPAVDVSSTSVALTEGGSAGSYRVKLHTDPGNGATVTVTPDSADTARVTVDGALTFTGGAAGDWEDWQTVTVTPLLDSDTASEDVVISHAVTGYGSVTAGPEVTVSLVDRGTGVTVSPTALSMQENASATYSLVLHSRPSSNVTITPSSSSDANATVGAAVTFTPATWNQERTVQVTGVDRGSATISHAVSSQDSAYAAITPSATGKRRSASP